MPAENHAKLLAGARTHIVKIRLAIKTVLERQTAKDESVKRIVFKLLPGDVLAEHRLAAHRQETMENLRQLHPSPYFSRCVFKLPDEERVMYFAKFSFSEAGIYSWITPAAQLRFAEPGAASYTRPDGTIRSGILESKDQYLIVDGKLLFFATESIGQARALVYQEHFTRRKTGFILPEVVEQMEKAQDTVIRASARGPLLITGPAGSGKTTLALHRVAYLLQSPETADLFPLETVLVLVQDIGTKEYFSHLLPELGIKGVVITTFAEWAWAILKIPAEHYVTRFGTSETEADLYEYAKLQTLRRLPELKYFKNAYVLLEKAYAAFFSTDQKALWQKQKSARALDRFDLTILLHYHLKKFGDFKIEKDYYEEKSNGTYRARRKAFALNYSLSIIDEFQNYLPEQINLLRGCFNKRLESVVYVGDLAQQTQLGTIQDLANLGTPLPADRLIKLAKVYRNTRQVLEYIASLGYSVTIPAGLKDGPAAAEYASQSSDEEINKIQKIIKTLPPGATLGVLAWGQEYLLAFQNAFSRNKNVHCLTLSAAQGVEFDVVCLVGIKEMEVVPTDIPPELVKEIARVRRDLLYVGLTRAMTELHVFYKLQQSFTNSTGAEGKYFFRTE